jgi:ribosomal-protein-alanine N-acetyltransferase
MDFSIARVTSTADLDDVLQVERASFTNPWTYDMYAWELQNSNISFLYVLRTEDGAVAAFCSFWLIFEELHINNLAVRPDYRRQGYGTALLRYILAEGARLGARRATLEVRQSNDVALTLYKRLGFVIAGVRKNYYVNPVEHALILWNENIQGC